MHCIFNHPFIGEGVNKRAWNLACDIVAEHTINELAIAKSDRQAEQVITIQRLQRKVKILTAEKIYRYLILNPIEAEELFALEEYFFADDHSRWYPKEKPPEGTSDESDENEGNDGNNGSDSDNDGDGNSNEGNSNQSGESGQLGKPTQPQEYSTTIEAKEWLEIAAKIQEDLETFSKKQGDAAGSLIQNLLSVTREKYEYTAFLRRFASLSEEMQINDEEFDYNFYTYGLSLYKKMPLIEPLEYKDTLRIREFIIAIDTSGSVMGSQVQRFVQKTYNILKQSGNLASRVNIHIVQCDAVIQDIVEIKSANEIDSYIKNLTLRGFGGTDFRPVFNYVNEQIAIGTFANLKGLIYFTDGCGTFPEYVPSYHSAFVFVEDDEFLNVNVPSWAIKLILSKEDI